MIIELSNVLVAKGNGVQLIMPNNNSKPTNFTLDERITITKIGKARSSKIGKLYNITRTLLYVNRLQKKEMVIITEPLQCAVLSFFAQRRFVRYLQADDHSIFDNGELLKFPLLVNLYKRLCRNSYKRGKFFLFNSLFTQSLFNTISGKRETGNIVSPAVNHEVFTPAAVMIETPSLRICLIGRTQVAKGFRDIIALWDILSLNDKNCIEEVSVITPDDLSGFELPDAFKLYLPVSDTEIAAVMQKADIFIFSSQNEGFGLPPLEAMACGCAVITGDCGGINDFVVKGSNALVYPPGDIYALASCLQRLVHDKEARIRMATNGQATAVEYTWENAARKFQEVISHFDPVAPIENKYIQ